MKVQDLIDYHEQKSLEFAREPNHQRSLWHIDAAKMLRKMNKLCKLDAVLRGSIRVLRAPERK